MGQLPTLKFIDLRGISTTSSALVASVKAFQNTLEELILVKIFLDDYWTSFFETMSEQKTWPKTFTYSGLSCKLFQKILPAGLQGMQAIMDRIPSWGHTEFTTKLVQPQKAMKIDCNTWTAPRIIRPVMASQNPREDPQPGSLVDHRANVADNVSGKEVLRHSFITY